MLTTNDCLLERLLEWPHLHGCAVRFLNKVKSRRTGLPTPLHFKGLQNEGS